jgi:hypothetical protein
LVNVNNLDAAAMISRMQSPSVMKRLLLHGLSYEETREEVTRALAGLQATSNSGFMNGRDSNLLPMVIQLIIMLP